MGLTILNRARLILGVSSEQCLALSAPEFLVEKVECQTRFIRGTDAIIAIEKKW